TELMPGEQAWQISREYTDKAYSLNPENAGVHYLLANIAFFFDADFQKALKHVLHSVELKPNYPEAQQFLTLLYVISGEMEKAKQHLEMAYSIDPLSQETLFFRAYFHYRTENYSDALKLFDECLEKNPYNIPAYIVRSYCLLKMEQYDKTLDFLGRMPKEIVVDDERLGIICLANILKKDDAETKKHFARLHKKAQEPTAFQAHSYLYLAYASMGKANEAFTWLNEAVKLKSSVLLLSYTDPLANALKNDSRYETYKNQFYLQPGEPAKPAQEKLPLLDSKTADVLEESLYRFILEEEPFLVPGLSLRSLAGQVEIHPNKLSWLLNERMGKNFNEFINYYRIEYFKKLALDPENSHISLIGLAYESGFNSKTVFNTYFKKEVGMTPKEFLKQNTPS
ncbi:helix-turn-helix domain-containing protein, partial [Mariniphaga sediminis]|uniref:helix-turn-helix domain-containing protein n=1 Tax=Mariniphaga sediminis TaxID=1628158 RepID=UPI0035663AB6